MNILILTDKYKYIFINEYAESNNPIIKKKVERKSEDSVVEKNPYFTLWF